MTGRILAVIAGVSIAVLTWTGPLPRLASGSFATHMAMHMIIVSLAMPLLASGLFYKTTLPRVPVSIPLAASLVDFAVIWAWHLPALHLFASQSTWGAVFQQASFAAISLLVWSVAFTTSPLAGALELFFTSMHMVLLGTLLSLAPRPLYSLLCLGGMSLDPLADQQLGGAIMLTLGGLAYITGALVIAGRVLQKPLPP
jgi:putative membrane protein